MAGARGEIAAVFGVVVAAPGLAMGVALAAIAGRGLPLEAEQLVLTAAGGAGSLVAGLAYGLWRWRGLRSGGSVMNDFGTRRAAAVGPVPEDADPALTIALLREALAEAQRSVVVFGSFYAVEYAQAHGLPEGHLAAAHYDILARAGARMDGWTRHELQGADSDG